MVRSNYSTGLILARISGLLGGMIHGVSKECSKGMLEGIAEGMKRVSERRAVNDI